MKNELINESTFGNFTPGDKILTKIANNQFTTHRYSKEWKILILLALLFDVTAVTLTVYAGYFYLSELITPILESKELAIISTIVILILLEFLVHFLLAKFFKFALKWHGLTATSILIFLSLVYFLSFQMSTNGLSINESKKVSKVEFIENNLNTEIENIQLETKENIKYYKNEIATIKANPSGWINGKRSVLTSQQLKDIKEYNGTINELRQTERTNIKELQEQAHQDKANNLTEVTATANKYYAFISILMLIELIASGFLMFSWSKIQNENDTEQHVKSKVIDISKQVDASITELYTNRFVALQNGLSIALQQHNNSSIPLEILSQEHQEQTIQKAEIINKNNVGFEMKTNTRNTTPGTIKKKECLFCGAELVGMHPAAKYCNAECRKQAWELKTGAKLKYKSKK